MMITPDHRDEAARRLAEQLAGRRALRGAAALAAGRQRRGLQVHELVVQVAEPLNCR